MQSRALLTFILSIGTLAMASPVIAQENIEQPRYEVMDSVDGVELRHYAKQIVAEVTVEAENSGLASYMGFRPLADFIFGNNRSADKIAMTAPVTTQERSSGTQIAMTAPVTTQQEGTNLYVVRFTMPSEWTMESLPTPNNPAVKITELSPQKIVAVRFMGNRSADQVEAASLEIANFMESRNLKPASQIIVAGYDGPNVPPIRRRWEVMVEAE